MENDHDEIIAMVREDLKAFLIKTFEILNFGECQVQNGAKIAGWNPLVRRHAIKYGRI